MTLTILMPALDEELSIEKTIRKIPRTELRQRGFETEILIVDGGSRDRTVEIARRNGAKVISSPRGYGRQYKAGFIEATGDIIVTADSDCSYPLDEVPRLLEIFEREKLDFISTNRFAGLENGSMFFLNHFGNRVLTCFFNALFGLKLKDSQSGMWVIRKKILQQMDLVGNGMSLSQEIKVEGYLKFKAKEVASTYRKRVGRVKLRMFRDGCDNLYQLFRKRISMPAASKQSAPKKFPAAEFAPAEFPIDAVQNPGELKVLVVNPPAFQNKDYIREGRCMQTKSSWAALWMPLSLAYIAAVLRRDGHRVKLIDCIAARMDSGELLENVKAFQPQLVVLNTAIPSIEGDLAVAALIKKFMPHIRILVIGLHSTLFEEKVLANFHQIDFAVCGEPEWVVARVAQALTGQEDFSKINGLLWRKYGKITTNPPQKLSANDIDELPLPARDLLDNDAYKLPTNGEKFTLLSVGRGCPFSCIYCTATIYYGKKFRKRTIGKIIDEIKECQSVHGISNFLFWGESFTNDPAYGEEICDEIIRQNLKITWSTTSRVDTLNATLLKKMKLAGCALLGLGIESLDQDVLDNAKKGTSLAEIKNAVAMVKESGISSMGHFVFGLPGDTRESAKKSIDFACHGGLDYAQFYCAVPYPKTELQKIALKNNWVETADWSQLDLTKARMSNDALSAKEIKKLRDRAYRKFYFRPKMFKQAWKEIKSVKSLFVTLTFIDWIKAGRRKVFKA